MPDSAVVPEGYALGVDCPHQCCSADGKYPHKHFTNAAECEGCQAIERGRTVEELLEVAAAWFEETNGPDKAWWADYARLTGGGGGGEPTVDPYPEDTSESYIGDWTFHGWGVG